MVCLCVFLFLISFVVTENTVYCCDKEKCSDDNLLAVVVIFRHGDRAPTDSFPNDPFFNESYWPMGHGQLTNKGKRRMYDLGKWIRNRYNSFLSEEYSPKTTFARSTDSDRCLTSAYAVLAGLYPPKLSQKWNKDLLWQPIPVHTVPTQKDDVLSMYKTCPKYVHLLQATMTSEPIKKISSKYVEFLNYVSKHSGWNNTSVRNIATLHANLEIYKSFKKSFVPPWTKSLDKKILEYLAGVDHGRYTLTPTLKRLLTGPFWANLLANFDNVIANVTNTPKFLMLSAHDRTLVTILNCLGLYDFVPPYFGDALIFEMRQSSEGISYINLFYKKLRAMDALDFGDCGVNCSYQKFKKAVAGLAVFGMDWEKECEIKNDNTMMKSIQKPFQM